MGVIADVSVSRPVIRAGTAVAGLRIGPSLVHPPIAYPLGIGWRRLGKGEEAFTANALTVYRVSVVDNRTPMPWLKFTAGAVELSTEPSAHTHDPLPIAENMGSR